MTREQIAERTPRSKTATDNPIFKFRRDTKVFYNDIDNELRSKPVKEGVEVRISGCNLGQQVQMTNVFLDDEWVVALNVDLQYVEGRLGVQSND